jgi:glycerol-3-phosphate acyltransferase PlsY
LGSIPVGLLVGRFFDIRDIRHHGSGNIGATNVLRTLGWKAAVWVYIGDIVKGAAAVLLAGWIFGRFNISSISIELLLVICTVMVVLGHVFPVFAGFKGGKGVNTALGAMFVILPLESFAGCIIFVTVVAVSRFISLGSLAGAVGFFLIVSGEYIFTDQHVTTAHVILAAVLAAMIVAAHRQNIRRLLAGKERRISFSTQSRETGA